MARARSSSSRLRYCNPSYYLNIPIRLALFFIALVCVSFALVWDRQTLVREHESSSLVRGRLSAYDLSGDKVFLDKAKDISHRLLPAWDTPSGIPYNIINLAHGGPHSPDGLGLYIRAITDAKLPTVPPQ